MRHDNSGGRIALRGHGQRQTAMAVGKTLIAMSATILSYLSSMLAGAADVSVTVTDRDGHGVDQVVVTVTPFTTQTSGAAKSAVMDQRNLEFVPRVLVVGVGARVNFPNNDSVSHQVYSFSEAKHFQLPLYKGQVHPPLTFDRAGLVVLGCNIHDSMVGYIYVTDAPYFGATESDGAVKFADVPPGDYQIVLWSPFIADPPASLKHTVHLDGAAPGVVAVKLASPLRARPEPRPRHPDWEY